MHCNLYPTKLAGCLRVFCQTRFSLKCLFRVVRFRCSRRVSPCGPSASGLGFKPDKAPTGRICVGLLGGSCSGFVKTSPERWKRLLPLLTGPRFMLCSSVLKRIERKVRTGVFYIRFQQRTKSLKLFIFIESDLWTTYEYAGSIFVQVSLLFASSGTTPVFCVFEATACANTACCKEGSLVETENVGVLPGLTRAHGRSSPDATARLDAPFLSENHTTVGSKMCTLTKQTNPQVFCLEPTKKGRLQFVDPFCVNTLLRFFARTENTQPLLCHQTHFLPEIFLTVSEVNLLSSTSERKSLFRLFRRD